MNTIKLIIVMIACLCVQSLYASSKANSPLGYWETIDEVSGQTKSIVQISETANKALYGRVIFLFSNPDKRCTACTGARKNQPILGMVIMENLRHSQENAGQWVNGEILDPRNGKQYHCNLLLMEGGRALQIRGYIGIPLFGRSQTWVRVHELPKSNAKISVVEK